MTNKKKLLLVDGSSLAFRAFYAIPGSLNRFMNKNGMHTNALFSFHRMLENEMEKEKPTHVLVAFDAGKTTFRHAFFTEYKAGRAKTPGEFREQMPYFGELLDAFGISHYELDNYEADDIIGTLSQSVDTETFDVVVLSGDRDLTQLAKENVRVDITVKGVSEIEENTPEYLMEKYGLTPHQIIDMKGLAGDSSDNIPGVTNIGEKTAVKLLQEYSTVEGVYAHIDDMKPSKRKENLIKDKDQAFLSKKLATIDITAPIQVTVDELEYKGKNIAKLIDFYKEMDFKQFLNQLDTTAHDAEHQAEKEAIAFEYVESITQEMFAEKGALYIEMLSDNYHTADIIGVSWANGEKIYVAEPDTVLFDPIFQEWARNKQNSKQVFDGKRTYVALKRYGVDIANIDFDVLLASYILNTNDNSKDLAEVAMDHDYYDVAPDESIYGKGAKLAIPEDPNVLYEHLARKTQAIAYLSEQLISELEANEQSDLFYKMELPLSTVLADMEITGIKVDAPRILEMRTEFTEKLQKMTQRIYQEAGEEFNINSPKQLGVILFEKMQLPVIKKTKTGYSTAVDVLEQLRSQAPIVDDILEYRQIAKIQSTYVEGLLKVIHNHTGKVHTRYIQTLTQTGRLSSVDPNLQNIPIRLEEGRKIRQAFVPSYEGWKIFSSDYSQIELRVLADISNDAHMKQAFIDDEDIHTSTANRIFGLDEGEEVTDNMRRHAKAVNFGIVYGISDYGLSQNLGISRKQAQQFIDTYLDKYPGVKQYMSDIIQKAKKDGYVTTLFHRRRYLRDINSKNFNLRSFAERTAMNTPIQGSAADIIKVAMIEMAKELKERGLKTRMLLQVHDELIFEAPEEEIAILEELVPKIMENAVHLSIPLKVESSYGDTWYDAK